MANPEVTAKKVQVTGYAGLQTGVIKSPTDKLYTNSGAILGGEVNYKGTFLRGQVEAGTALGGKVELGHTFDIGKNMGLELSAKAQMNKSLVGNNTFTVEDKMIDSYALDIENRSLINVNTQAHSDYSNSWKSGETRFGGSAKLTFGSNKARFGVGIEAGTRKGNRPDMNYSFEAHNYTDVTVNGETQTREVHYANLVAETTNYGVYVTPTISADVKLGKNFTFTANADLFQGQAGVRYNF